MTTLNQIPGELDIAISSTDDFSYLVDFDISLTGYTFEAKVISASGNETAITIANTDLSAGQITMSLTDTQIATIGKGVHKWYLAWTVGGATRRVLAGKFTIEAYL